MVFRRSFLTLGLLTMTSGFALSAHAQGGANPALSFHPAKGWAASSSGDACAISSEYNNGFAVNFNGSGGSVRTLGVDFMQNIFEPGKVYNVGFRIPGQPPNKFSARAENASTLDINVDNGTDLASALNTASAFDLNVEGNDFRFLMAGYAGGAKTFNDCLAAGKPAPHVDQLAAAPVDGAAPPPPPVDPNTSTEAKANIVPVQEIFPEDSANTDAPFIPPSRERLSEKINRKIQDNPEIVSIGNTSPAIMPPAEPAPLMQVKADPVEAPVAPPEQVSEKEKTAPVLKDDLKDVENLAQAQEPDPVISPPAVTFHKTPPVAIKREKIEQKSDLTSFAETEPSANEPFAGTPALERPRVDPEMLRKISDLEHQVQTLKKENDDLNRDFSSTVHETKTERMSISSENWNLERATMRYNEAEREIKRLGQLLQQERAQCSMEKQDLEAQLFDPQVTSTQQLAKLGDLERKLTEAKENMERQRQQYDERIRILEGQKAQ